MGIILISFLVEVFARGPLFVMTGLFRRDDTIPFLGTNVETIHMNIVMGHMVY